MNPEIWGEDPSELRPERWIDGDKDKIRELEGVFDLLFHAGKWHCLGKSIALMELNKVFV
jgi:cytochrome P450